MSLRRYALIGTILAHAACATPAPARVTSLSDADFWQLSTALSEPAGTFEHSDNLVSNETFFAQLTQLLRSRGGAYIGVGPEQNFSYIARIQPELAFIVDIRQENRNLHLMYKALFEIADDRADFVGRLFSRPRPDGLGEHAAVSGIFDAYAAAAPSAALFEKTRQVIRHRLLDVHRFPLTATDLETIDTALTAFLRDGPDIRYGRSARESRTRPSYRTLMTATDLRGTARSYLGSAEAFASVKAMQGRNLIVPVVGNFAGPHAIRQIGQYLRQHGIRVTAYYASNVEVYLTRDQRRVFCDSVASLPHDEDAYFVGSRRVQPLAAKLVACAGIRPSLHWP